MCTRPTLPPDFLRRRIMAVHESSYGPGNRSPARKRENSSASCGTRYAGRVSSRHASVWNFSNLACQASPAKSIESLPQHTFRNLNQPFARRRFKRVGHVPLDDERPSCGGVHVRAIPLTAFPVPVAGEPGQFLTGHAVTPLCLAPVETV